MENVTLNNTRVRITSQKRKVVHVKFLYDDNAVQGSQNGLVSFEALWTFSSAD